MCRLCARSHGCQSYVHVCLTPRGEQVCGCMHFFLRLHTDLLLCLCRSVPHPLLHVLVCPQMPVLNVLVLCAYGCTHMGALGMHVGVYICVL